MINLNSRIQQSWILIVGNINNRINCCKILFKDICYESSKNVEGIKNLYGDLIEGRRGIVRILFYFIKILLSLF